MGAVSPTAPTLTRTLGEKRVPMMSMMMLRLKRQHTLGDSISQVVAWASKGNRVGFRRLLATL